MRTKRKPRITLGGPTVRCRACGRRVNERTGTPFNDLRYPTDIVLLAVLWHRRYKLSFRDVAELLLERGDAVTHETAASGPGPGPSIPLATRRRLFSARWRSLLLANMAA